MKAFDVGMHPPFSISRIVKKTNKEKTDKYQHPHNWTEMRNFCDTSSELKMIFCALHYTMYVLPYFGLDHAFSFLSFAPMITWNLEIDETKV